MEELHFQNKIPAGYLFFTALPRCFLLPTPHVWTKWVSCITSFILCLVNPAILSTYHSRHRFSYAAVTLVSLKMNSNCVILFLTWETIQVQTDKWHKVTLPDKTIRGHLIVGAEGLNLLLTDTVLSDDSSPTDTSLWWAKSRGLISSSL